MDCLILEKIILANDKEPFIHGSCHRLYFCFYGPTHPPTHSLSFFLVNSTRYVVNYLKVHVVYGWSKNLCDCSGSPNYFSDFKSYQMRHDKDFGSIMWLPDP